MMSDRDERLLTLLARQATEGLDPVDRDELDAFCRAEARGISSFERAGAAIALAHTDVTEPMPLDVRTRIAASLRAAMLDAGRPPAAPETATAPAERFASTNQSVTVGTFGTHENDRGAATRRASTLPWLAAAAALALAVIGWWPQGTEPVVGPAGQPPTAAALRTQLLDSAPGTVQVAWSATEDPDAVGAAGDVVWSTDRQRGFMRFTGLPANDPAVSQYQLWIFDEAQDERFPIDGGVFDVNADGETVVAIDPKIAVTGPTLFAVTVERPGGVVVSSRERIVLVAAVG